MRRNTKKNKTSPTTVATTATMAVVVCPKPLVDAAAEMTVDVPEVLCLVVVVLALAGEVLDVEACVVAACVDEELWLMEACVVEACVVETWTIEEARVAGALELEPELEPLATVELDAWLDERLDMTGGGKGIGEAKGTRNQ
ncbi:hypothetical protein HWV62_30310 [Athelia sp. TMB]|nr:hypothetical protein HWV62_30310 [Athelia sp. TMB]